MRPGYKQTEVGVIPEDWEVLSVFELADKQKSRFDDGDWVEAEHITDKGIRLIQTGNIGVGEYVEKEAKKYIYESSFDQLRCKELRVGDVLICRLAEPAGRACILPNIGEQKVITSVDVTIFRPDEERFDRGYLTQYFSTPQWFDSILEQVGGTTHKRIARSALGSIQVPLPTTKEEQSAIATALSDVDALLAGLDKLIAKKRDLKQAAMQQLLTGKARLPEFAGEWEVKRFGDLASLKSGDSITAERIDEYSEFPCYGGNGLRGYTKTYTHEGKFALIGRQGALCGNVVSATGKFFASEHALVVTPKPNIGIQWLAYVLADAHLNQYAESSAQPGLSAAKLIVLEFNVPSTEEEQTAIAEVLSDMDAELAALEQRREKTSLLKQGMMQELLTGKTRLVASAAASPAATAQVIDFPSKNEKPSGESVQQESKTGGKKANVHFIRSVLAAEIIDRLHDEPTFGHVKCEKVIYLADRLCKVDTGSHYHRDAAGPYDNRALRSIDSQLKKQQWFDAQKVDGRYRYLPMAKRGEHKQYFDRYFGKAQSVFDQIIDTFRSMRTEQCEIVATLFEAWHDLLERQLPVSDDVIVHEVLNNWHESKQRISEDRWRKALDWMRGKGFVPDGAEPAC